MTKILEPHHFANVFPELEGDAFNALVEDIKARGTLKEWKTQSADSAVTATSQLIDQLKAADLIEEKKGRKTAA